eukprot:13940939-Alexandrium_andersonii.AAC.1
MHVMAKQHSNSRGQVQPRLPDHPSQILVHRTGNEMRTEHLGKDQRVDMTGELPASVRQVSSSETRLACVTE